MKAWLSMMPVEGERRAAVQDSAGSSASASSRRQQGQVGHPVGGGAALDGFELARLLLVGRHDQLAAAGVRHAALPAIVVEHVLALDAGARHQAAGGVVDAGVDHLGVARGGLGADPLRGVQHQHLAPGERQRARHRQADDAGADHHAIEFVHRFLLAHFAGRSRPPVQRPRNTGSRFAQNAARPSFRSRSHRTAPAALPAPARPGRRAQSHSAPASCPARRAAPTRRCGPPARPPPRPTPPSAAPGR